MRSGELRPGELLAGVLLPGKLLPGELRAWTEPTRVRLSGAGSAARATRTGLSQPRLPGAQLAVTGEASPRLTAARPPAVGRRRVWAATRLRTAWLRAARACPAVLVAAVLSVGRRCGGRRATRKRARILHACLRTRRRIRPTRWSGLRPGHGRALRPGAGRRHRLAARSVAIGATVTRPRSPGGLPRETRPPGESAPSGPGTAGRARTAGRAGSTGRARTGSRPRTPSRAGTTGHAVVTGTPGKPRTPIPRAIGTRQARIAS
jgi:hypothetical protein